MSENDGTNEENAAPEPPVAQPQGAYIMGLMAIVADDDNPYEVVAPPAEGVRGFKLSECKAKKREDKLYDLTAVLNGRQSDNADGVIPKGVKSAEGDTIASAGTLFYNTPVSLSGIALTDLIATRMKDALYNIDSGGWAKFIAKDVEICDLDLYATKGDGRGKVGEEYKMVLASWKIAANKAGHKGTLSDGTKLTHAWVRAIELDETNARHAGMVGMLTEAREKIAAATEAATTLDVT